MKYLFIFIFFMVSTMTANTLPQPLQTGQKVPEVKLLNAEGTQINLSTLLNGKSSVLIFYRGGWCPFCNKHLLELGEIVGDLEEAGVRILAISPDLPENIRQTQSLHQLPYTLLSDAEMNAAKAFGIAFKVPFEIVAKYKEEFQIDLEAASGETHHLLPHPAVFIVDGKGIIRFVHVNPDYKNRLEPSKIVEFIKTLANT